MARRPTHKECSGKLRQALEALENGSYQTIDADRHFTPDRDELVHRGGKKRYFVSGYERLVEGRDFGW